MKFLLLEEAVLQVDGHTLSLGLLQVNKVALLLVVVSIGVAAGIAESVGLAVCLLLGRLHDRVLEELGVLVTLLLEFDLARVHCFEIR